MRFRERLLTVLTVLATSSAVQAAETLQVFSTSGCGCCLAWIERAKEAGLEATNENLPMADLYARKMQAGLKPGQVSCHTAYVGGYVVEGHVPAAEVLRMLAERPDGVGLAVAGMPAGSPGMGESDEAYDVVLVSKDGTSSVYATYLGETKVSAR